MLLALMIVMLILVLGCADTRHMARCYNKMEAERPVDTVYFKGGMFDRVRIGHNALLNNKSGTYSRAIGLSAFGKFIDSIP